MTAKLKVAISIIVSLIVWFLTNEIRKNQKEIAEVRRIEQSVIGERFIFVKDTMFVIDYYSSSKQVRDHNGNLHSLIFFNKHKLTDKTEQP